MGSQLCDRLDKLGHDVAVIDENANHFDNLSDTFSGYTLSGVPIDKDVLKAAGIDGCDAVAAVTQDDNTNVMVCQIASEIFHVPRVLARVFDPRRGNVFSQFGLHTVCPTNISVDAVIAMLGNEHRMESVHLDTATVAFDALPVSASVAGKTLGTLCDGNTGHQGFFGVLRPDGNLLLAHAGSAEIVQPDDRLLYVKVVD